MRRTQMADRWLAVLALAVVVGGCGGDDTQPPGPAGQAIARVNGQELTVHQLQAELAGQTAPANESSAEQLKNAAALNLLDRVLVVQAARTAGVDRDPAVVQQIARSRDQVLASAYLQRVMADAGTPTETESKAYYDAHPELFARRQAYVLAQVVTDATVPRAELDAQGREFESPAQLVQWLRERGAPADLRTVTLGAEQVPTAVLTRLSTLKPGQALVASVGAVVQVNYLLDTRAAPVMYTDARDSIMQVLTTQRRQQAVQREIERLRADADLTWLGEFAASPPRRPDAAAGQDTPPAGAMPGTAAPVTDAEPTAADPGAPHAPPIIPPLTDPQEIAP